MTEGYKSIEKKEIHHLKGAVSNFRESLLKFEINPNKPTNMQCKSGCHHHSRS